MKNWLKRFFDSLIISREREVQRRISALALNAVDRHDLDRKMKEAGFGGL